MPSTTMTDAILERTSKFPSAVPADVIALASKAKSMLGYKFLADRVLQPITLSRVLKDLDIQPYKESTVDTYKEAKLKEVREARVNTKPKHHNRWGQPLTERVVWKRIPIEDYRKAIPEFALDKAVRLVEANPSIKLFVDELQIVRQAKAVPKDLDPFLVAQLGPETFYIEVWDERKFESKLY